jgi:ketosteroid isomerase-like protein
MAARCRAGYCVGVSQENVEIVRRALSHLNETGEPDWDLYDPDLVWTSRPDGPAHFAYRGLDGLRRGSASMRQVWAELHADILETVESGDVVVSVIRWHLRGRSGVELDEVEGWASWIRDGKIARIEQYGSKAEALEAAGRHE